MVDHVQREKSGVGAARSAAGTSDNELTHAPILYLEARLITLIRCCVVLRVSNVPGVRTVLLVDLYTSK